MNPIRTAIVAFIVVGAVAACSNAEAVTSPRPAPTAVSPMSAIATPTQGPTPSPASIVVGKSLPVDVATGPTISLYEYKVIAPVSLKAGKSTFTITNFGTMPHELLVFKSALAPAKYPTDASGDIIEDGPGVTLLSDGDNIDPTKAQVRTIDLTPGTYVFVCNIPGHFKQGMFTTVTVTR